jgi:AcrR family transcriptional regulator
MTSAQNGGGDIPRSLKLMWQLGERPSRGPKPALTLDVVVDAAVGLADREGITALSMRKVAAELGVGTMSLYRYVPGKGELLDLMLDRVYAPGDDLAKMAGEDWRTAMERVGLTTYQLYRDHPWLLQVNQSRPLLGPNALLGFDVALAALDGLGLNSQERVGVISTLDAFITGIARHHVLLQQASEESGISDEAFWAAQTPVIETAMASGCYPHVFALSEDAFSMAAEQILTFGLTRLLDGVESYITHRRPAH